MRDANSLLLTDCQLRVVDEQRLLFESLLQRRQKESELREDLQEILKNCLVDFH